MKRKKNLAINHVLRNVPLLVGVSRLDYVEPGRNVDSLGAECISKFRTPFNLPCKACCLLQYPRFGVWGAAATAVNGMGGCNGRKQKDKEGCEEA